MTTLIWRFWFTTKKTMGLLQKRHHISSIVFIDLTLGRVVSGQTFHLRWPPHFGGEEASTGNVRSLGAFVVFGQENTWKVVRETNINVRFSWRWEAGYPIQDARNMPKHFRSTCVDDFGGVPSLDDLLLQSTQGWVATPSVLGWDWVNVKNHDRLVKE